MSVYLLIFYIIFSPMIELLYIRKVLYYGMGFVGIVIHEISHLLMALIFWNRIDSVSLFQIEPEMSGHVVTSYNKKNLYHSFGIPIIAIAPIIVMGTIIYFIASEFNVLIIPINDFSLFITQFEFSVLISQSWNIFFELVKSVFSELNFINMFAFWVVLSIAIFISPSKEDLSGYFRNLFKHLLILTTIFVFIRLINPNFYTQSIISLNRWLSQLSLILNVLLLINLIFYILLKIVHFVFNRF